MLLSGMALRSDKLRDVSTEACIETTAIPTTAAADNHHVHEVLFGSVFSWLEGMACAIVWNLWRGLWESNRHRRVKM